MWTDSKATIIAALIAAVVALVTLIIAKESKTSEFRQAWIDALRSEIGEAISSASALFILLDAGKQHDPESLFVELWSRTTATIASIDLRLNLNESDHQQLSTLLRRAEQMLRDADDGNSSSREDREELQDSVVAISRTILKREWQRVKAGESAFLALKWISAAFLIIVGGIAFLHHYFFQNC